MVRDSAMDAMPQFPQNFLDLQISLKKFDILDNLFDNYKIQNDKDYLETRIKLHI